MKTPAILLGLALAAMPAFADQADDYYQKGLAAITRGEPEQAAAAFRKALSLRPDHAYARFQLGKLQGQAGQLKAKRREGELTKVKLDEVNFDGVTLSEALTALNHMVEKKTAKDGKEGVTPNFMVQDSSGKLGDTEVTLRLKNVPAKIALDYLLEQAGGKARYDEHAIVILPRK